MVLPMVKSRHSEIQSGTKIRSGNERATRGIPVASEGATTMKGVRKENIAAVVTKEGVMVRIERTEEITTSVETVTTGLTTNSGQVVLQITELREEVDSLIEQGMTDLWLLLAGEGLASRPYRRNHDGQPFAVALDGQLHLLGSKPSVLDALRSVGLDLSAYDPKCEG
jgi:hypothetical protein